MSWWKTAKPGDRVVCVDDSWGQGISPYKKCPLIMGRVYEIASIIMSDGVGPSGDGVLPSAVVVGLPNPYFRSGEELGFDVARFRPVQTKSTETGMAILKRILNGAPVSEDA